MAQSLESFDGPTAILPALTKIVEDFPGSLSAAQKSKYAKLGQKYLSAIVAQVLLFRLETPVKDTKALLEANISPFIDSKYFKGECQQKLDIGLGRVFLQNDSQRMKGIVEDVKSIFELEFSNNQSYQKFIFDVSISSIGKKQNNSKMMEDDEESMESFSLSKELNSLSTTENSFSIYKRMFDIEKHIKEVESYLKDKNGTTELNLLQNYKQKTIKVADRNQLAGAKTRHIVELEFVNFLDDNKIVNLTATQEGNNKNVARQKASSLMLRKFFTEHPFIFKDYTHCMRVKGK